MQEHTPSLVWLASYPKSGNTWLRAFLANYLIAAERPLNFDEIRQVSFGDSAAGPIERLAGGQDPRRMPHPQMLELRTAHLADVSQRAPVSFVKTHNAYARIGGVSLIPASLTRCAIHIVRDPRDVVLSYADHWGLPVEGVVGLINNPGNVIPPNPATVTQFLGRWSDHVQSWCGARDIRVLTVRYEDLLADPEVQFERIVRHLGAPLDKAVLSEAVTRASFPTLRKIEDANGFSEKGNAQEHFFRKGKAGQWRDALDPALARQIWADHGAVMMRLGYL